VSRAFVREDAGVETEAVPARAPLPDGTPNLVTPRGWRLLLEEREALERERDRRLGKGVVTDAISDRLSALAARIACARVLESDVGGGTVRFGARVGVVQLGPGAAAAPRWLSIVGVDEADPETGRIAHLSPVATALIGARVGDLVTVATSGTQRQLRVVSVDEYGS